MRTKRIALIVLGAALMGCGVASVLLGGQQIATSVADWLAHPYTALTLAPTPEPSCRRATLSDGKEAVICRGIGGSVSPAWGVGFDGGSWGGTVGGSWGGSDSGSWGGYDTGGFDTGGYDSGGYDSGSWDSGGSDAGSWGSGGSDSGAW